MKCASIITNLKPSFFEEEKTGAGRPPTHSDLFRWKSTLLSAEGITTGGISCMEPEAANICKTEANQLFWYVFRVKARKLFVIICVTDRRHIMPEYFKTQEFRRHIMLAVLIGIIIGIIGAIVKFGWEVPFPPRTPLRDATNPPQELLQQLGFSSQFTHMTYMFSDTPRHIISFIVHFSFSIAFGIIYAVWVEYKPAIRLWQGTVFGVAVWLVFHVVLMPLIGTVPPPWDQPFDEHFSEFFGHAFWLWVMELCRSDLRFRMTHEIEPPVPHLFK